MRKVKYIRNVDGLDLEKEKLLLKDKPYTALQVLCTSKGVLTDVAISRECGMNLRTYKRWKNYLVMIGLLQVRQLNASSYVISIGEKAIEKDNKLNAQVDCKRMASKLFTPKDCTMLIDSDTFDKNERKEATAEEIDKYLKDNDIGYYGGKYGH